MKCNTCCWHPFFCIGLHLLSACKSKEGIGQQSCARDQSVACTFLHTQAIVCATCLRFGANSVNKCKRACCHLRKRWHLSYCLHLSSPSHLVRSQAQPGVGRSNSNSKPGLTAPGLPCRVFGRDRESDHRMRENKEDRKSMQEPWVGRAVISQFNSMHILGGITGDENEGFELQTSYTAPLRPVLPRFPLLPVAMSLGSSCS